jgi:hypothetical protein
MWQIISYYTVLAFEALFGIFGIRLYEEPRYQLVERIADRVEIRQYAPRLAAEVELPLAGKRGREEAFRLLFAYIAGANRDATGVNTMMAMTTPVAVDGNTRISMPAPVQTSEANNGMRMQFFLPAKYNLDNAPRPADERVKLVSYGHVTIAMLRFSGRGVDFAERQSELIARLKGSAWRPTGAPYTLYYDAPFTLPFLRRNEAAVAVVEEP